mmetsp:Transcript_5039/g.16784  ORF Transcript_5039/g.16784 Transcript_5039/m.16784 type:complete len:379 (+) Transcript_5039:336-1472(+)
MAATTSSRSLRIKTKSAASMAISVPAPMAMPTSAAASAGASLMPSPTMATTGTLRRATVFTAPVTVFFIGGAFSSSIFAAFPAGDTSACTDTIPHSAAIARAVCQLSPVTKSDSTPIRLSAAMTPAASGRIGSVIASAPTTCLFIATNTHVCASRCTRPTCVATSLGTSISASSRIFLFPTTTSTPSNRHRRPSPGTISTSVTFGSFGVVPASFLSSAFNRPFAYVNTARAMGCSLCDSAAATARRNCASATTLRKIATSTTVGFPTVRVPVLSNATTVTCPARSNPSAPLMRIPLDAPTPVPTITAVGVARPSAHGHAVTSTLTPNISAKTIFVSPSGTNESGKYPASNAAYHANHVAAAAATTKGTNTPDILSANA